MTAQLSLSECKITWSNESEQTVIKFGWEDGTVVHTESLDGTHWMLSVVSASKRIVGAIKHETRSAGYCFARHMPARGVSLAFWQVGEQGMPRRLCDKEEKLPSKTETWLAAAFLPEFEAYVVIVTSPDGNKLVVRDAASSIVRMEVPFERTPVYQTILKMMALGNGCLLILFGTSAWTPAFRLYRFQPHHQTTLLLTDRESTGTCRPSSLTSSTFVLELKEQRHLPSINITKTVEGVPMPVLMSDCLDVVPLSEELVVFCRNRYWNEDVPPGEYQYKPSRAHHRSSPSTVAEVIHLESGEIVGRWLLCEQTPRQYSPYRFLYDKDQQMFYTNAARYRKRSTFSRAGAPAPSIDEKSMARPSSFSLTFDRNFPKGAVGNLYREIKLPVSRIALSASCSMLEIYLPRVICDLVLRHFTLF